MRAEEAPPKTPGPPTVELARAALVALAALMAHLSSMRTGFFSDDWQWLARMNPTLERPSYVFSVFFRDFNPVLHSSFVLDWLVGAGEAWSFHLQSLLVHGLNAGLLYLLARRLGIAALPAGLATLLWAWSPRLVEAVVWPAARGHSLSLCFVLIALAFWAERGCGRLAAGRLAAGLLAWVLGLLTKETALVPMVLLPLLLPGRWKDPRLLASVIGTGVVFVAGSLLFKPAAYSGTPNLESLALKLPFLLLRPLELGDFHDFTWLSSLLVFAALAATLWLLRRTAAFVGLVWVSTCTLPFLPLEKLSSRYLYLPAAGWVLVFGVLLQGLLAAVPGRSKRLASVLIGGVLTVAFSLQLARIQWEIEAHAIVAEPHDRLADLAREPLSRVLSGETVVLADLSARNAVAALAAELEAGPFLPKLLPFRPRGVGGLIELPDLLNAARPREPGRLAFPVPAPGPAPRRVFAYDGESFVEVHETLLERVPPERVLAARWDVAERFFEAAVHDPER